MCIEKVRSYTEDDQISFIKDPNCSTAFKQRQGSMGKHNSKASNFQQDLATALTA